MASRLSATLRVRVEEARGLLPLAEAAEGDAPLLVTLRLAPGETKHSARTRAVRRGLEPAWHEEIEVRPLPPEARFVEFKVRREAEGLFSGRAFLGRVAVRIPRRGSPPEEGWFELRAGDKHADELAARCRRAGRPPGELGELKLSVERVEPRPSDDDSGRASPRTPHGRGAEAEPPRRRAAATPPTPDDDDDDADQARHPRHCRHTHNDDEISASHPREAVHATHVHVAVVAARGLLPSDFEAAEAGEKGDAAPSSDPYASARLLPALPEERHVTRVLPRTTDPLWEEELIFRRVHGSYGVEIKVWDYDPLTKDDYLGEVSLPLPDEAAPVADAEAAAAVAATPADAAEAATEAEEEDVSPPAASGRHPAVALVTAAGGPTPRVAVALAEAVADPFSAPPPPSEGAASARRRPGVVEGWFPLEASQRYADDVAAALRRAGRQPKNGDESIPPGALGEVFVRITYGNGQHRPDAARAAVLLRPAAHREAVASLRIRVDGARGLPPPPRDTSATGDEDGIVVAVRCERQRGATPAMPLPAGGGGEVTWPAEASTFDFQITEITSDAVLALQLRRRGALVATLGEVPLSLPLLLAPDAGTGARAVRGGAALSAVAGPAWAAVLAPRAPGEALFRTAAAAGDAQIRYEAALTMHASPARAYTASEPLPPQPRAGPPDAARDELLPGPHAAAAATHAAARLADAVLAIVAAPLRTALYMQSWQEPVLDVGAVLLLALTSLRRTAGVAAAAWPIWLVAFLLLNGYVSYRIHAGDAPPGSRGAAITAAASSDSDIDADADADAEDDTSADARPMRAPGGRLPALHERERAAAASHYAAHRAALARFAFAADAGAAFLERCAGALTWQDPALTALAASGLLFCAFAVTLLLSALQSLRLLSASGVVGFAVLYALVPMFAPLSRAALDAVDLRLSEVSPVRLRSLCAGTGLRNTALADSPPPGATPAMRRAAAAQRREAAAQREARGARGATHGGAAPQKPPPPGTVQHALRAAAPRLLARAPDEPRATHLRVSRHAALAPPPQDDLAAVPL